MRSYVWRDLVRNPRRTLASLIGVTLGVALFSSVLFFIDGSAATMTQRALAPLALDMQTVLKSPLGGGLRFEERISRGGALGVGQEALVTLTVRNDSSEPANEVVIYDEPARPLVYVGGTTTLNGKVLRDPAGKSPLSQQLGGSGLNIGTVRPGQTVRLTYRARARSSVSSTQALRLRATISTREDFVPAPANAHAGVTLEEVRAKIARIHGVTAATSLSFVDLPPASVTSGGRSVPGPVRVFAFDRRYLDHYPSIRIASGSMKPEAALLSAEAARALGARTRTTIALELPGRGTPLTLPVSGVADLSRAKPLFSSRKARKFEDFLYVPDSVVVSPATFEREIIPAFRAAKAERGVSIKSFPVSEVDVLVDRAQLRSDPASALAQTEAIARSVRRVAPDQTHLVDNVSNALAVAVDDAAVGKRMFVFLGLPGALLAAFFAAFVGSILATTQRREHASLRIRGAHRGHLRRLLLYRTLVLAGVAALLGTALGFLSVVAILGSGTVFDAAPGDLVQSTLASLAVGMVATAIGLYVPARRSLNRQVSEVRGELAVARVARWQRLRLDLALLATAAVGQAVALATGVLDSTGGGGSVSAGEAVTLPSYLLLAPLVAWAGGSLLCVRAFGAVTSRLPVPRPPRFGPIIRGTLSRSLRRRSSELATGVVGLGLVVAFGMSLEMFSATYDAGKAADARFVIGSDVRVTPSVLTAPPNRLAFAAGLRVAGVAAATPVLSRPENSVLIGERNQKRTSLAAIEPASFTRTAALSDSFFVDRTAAGALAALAARQPGLLVEASAAEDLNIEAGDSVQVLLARGTKRETRAGFRVVGLFERFPGFPEGIDLVANLRDVETATGSKRADFFLASTVDHSPAGLARATSALRGGAARTVVMDVDSTATALDKDQSSLTALNIQGLVDLGSLYTLLMCPAVIAIFVFGLMLQRRREYVTLRAQGMQSREIRALVLGEAAVVAVCGLAAGLLVGAGMSYLLVHVLQPLFILDPGLTVPAGEVMVLAALAMSTTLVAALVATVAVQRLNPAELLREA
jgi:putative ABC transport system permease protein